MSLKYEHLLGRPFTGIGGNDCFAMVIDFYRDNFEIEIPNYARPHDWSSDKLDLMRLCYERAGFDMIVDWKIKDLRPADLLAIAIGEGNPNHLAIFVGDDTILHQLYGKMSRAEPLRDFWRNHACYIFRHPSVPDLRPVYPDVDIGDLIHARNHPEIG